MVHTYLPFFDLKRIGGGSFVAKAYTKSLDPKLVELNADMLGSYSLTMSDNKYYADFDDLFVDYFATIEDATIKQTQSKPQPKQPQPITTDPQRRYINVIVSVDMNATKAEIMAEIEKTINTMNIFVFIVYYFISPR